jgi:hypothetical protein
MKKIIYSLMFLLLFSYGCTDLNDSSIAQVSYGTSFGMCAGYCKHDMVIKSNLITYNCSGWNNLVEPVSRTEAFNSAGWDSIGTDLNMDAFFALPEIIGCPDCADGGAEWLEIKLANGKTHKVTYEYNNEPDDLESVVEILREKLSKNECR